MCARKEESPPAGAAARRRRRARRGAARAGEPADRGATERGRRQRHLVGHRACSRASTERSCKRREKICTRRQTSKAEPRTTMHGMRHAPCDARSRCGGLRRLSARTLCAFLPFHSLTLTLTRTRQGQLATSRLQLIQNTAAIDPKSITITDDASGNLCRLAVWKIDGKNLFSAKR